MLNRRLCPLVPFQIAGAGHCRRLPCPADAACVPAGLRAILLAIAALGPSACAGIEQVSRTTYNVEKLGHGAYSVRTHIIGPMGGADDAKADNIQAATKHCAKKGLAMTAISDKGGGGLAAEDTLTFRCAPPARTS